MLKGRQLAVVVGKLLAPMVSSDGLSIHCVVWLAKVEVVIFKKLCFFFLLEVRGQHFIGSSTPRGLGTLRGSVEVSGFREVAYNEVPSLSDYCILRRRGSRFHMRKMNLDLK